MKIINNIYILIAVIVSASLCSIQQILSTGDNFSFENNKANLGDRNTMKGKRGNISKNTNTRSASIINVDPPSQNFEADNNSDEDGIDNVNQPTNALLTDVLSNTGQPSDNNNDSNNDNITGQPSDNNNDSNNDNITGQMPTKRGGELPIVDYVKVYNSFTEAYKKKSGFEKFMYSNVGVLNLDFTKASVGKAVYNYDNGNVFYKGFGCLLGGLCRLFDIPFKMIGCNWFNELSHYYWKCEHNKISDVVSQITSLFGLIGSICFFTCTSFMAGVGVMWSLAYINGGIVISIVSSVVGILANSFFYNKGYFYSGLAVGMTISTLMTYFGFKYLILKIRMHKASNLEFEVSNRGWSLWGSKQDTSWYTWIMKHYIVSSIIGFVSLIGLGYICYNVGFKDTTETN